jgi:Family of unknown function (DUF6169)
LQSHYNFIFDNITNTYNFVTKNNILYRIAFIVDETFSTISGENIANVYPIIIEKANGNIEPFDPKVSKTVENIIEQFFLNIDNSLVYICSEANDKAKARHEIFDRWYKNSIYKHVIVKIDNILNIKISENEVQKLYTSFMFHSKNPNYNKLIEIYNQIEDMLNDIK